MFTKKSLITFVINLLASTPAAAAAEAVYALKGEILGIELRPALGTELPANAQAFEIKTVTTLMPSFQGARVGAHEDPVVPVAKLEKGKNYWIDLKIARTASAGETALKIGGRDYALTIVNAAIPERPTMPMYIELQSAQTLAAHKLEDNVIFQGPITKKYVDLYREHRIEPIKQGITHYPTDDLDQWKQFNASWRQLVVDGAIAPPCIFGPDLWRAPDAAMLKRVARQVPNGWVYAWDEGEASEYMTGLALERVKLIRREAPQMKIMITRQEDPRFLPYVDTFTPVLDWFKQPGRVQTYTKSYGLYTSCMSQGNCKDKTNPADVEPASGTPMMVLDADPVHARAFPVMVHALGGQYGLYFNGTQRLPTAWLPGGQYNEGGNGDGTLVYTCGDRGCPSLRMKRIRQGMNDVEWLVLAKARGLSVAAPVKSPYDWSKQIAEYDAIRASVARAERALGQRTSSALEL